MARRAAARAREQHALALAQDRDGVADALMRARAARSLDGFRQFGDGPGLIAALADRLAHVRDGLSADRPLAPVALGVRRPAEPPSAPRPVGEHRMIRRERPQRRSGSCRLRLHFDQFRQARVGVGDERYEVVNRLPLDIAGRNGPIVYPHRESPPWLCRSPARYAVSYTTSRTVDRFQVHARGPWRLGGSETKPL